MFDLPVYYMYLQYFDTVGWVFWPVKTVSHRPITCVGGDVKHCTINQSIMYTLLRKGTYCHTLPCDVGFSETVTSLSYFLHQSGSVVPPSTVRPPPADALRRLVFDMVDQGRYSPFTARPVFRLDNAFSLYVIGRLDTVDARAILLAITARWKTLLGSLFCWWFFKRIILVT